MRKVHGEDHPHTQTAIERLERSEQVQQQQEWVEEVETMYVRPHAQAPLPQLNPAQKNE